MNHSFYGWYLKCQSETQTLGGIPAIHNTGNKRTCSIQVITDNDANIRYYGPVFAGAVYGMPTQRLEHAPFGQGKCVH